MGPDYYTMNPPKRCTTHHVESCCCVGGARSEGHVTDTQEDLLQSLVVSEVEDVRLPAAESHQAWITIMVNVDCNLPYAVKHFKMNFLYYKSDARIAWFIQICILTQCLFM